MYMHMVAAMETSSPDRHSPSATARRPPVPAAPLGACRPALALITGVAVLGALVALTGTRGRRRFAH